MKKFLSIVVLSTMLVGMAGCTANKDADSANNSEVPTLVWYNIGDKQADVKSVMEKVNQLTEDKIGAKLDLQFIDTGAYTERMQLNMASSDTFDMCFTGFVNPFAQAVARGGLLPMDEYLEGTPKLKESLPDYAWNAAKGRDGKIYAVPNMQIMAFGLHAYTFKDYADKYGLDISKVHTVDDLVPYLEKIKANEPSLMPCQYGFLEDAFAIGTDRELLLSSLISAMFHDDGTVTFVPKAKADYYKKGLEKTHEWYQKGLLRSDIASVIDDSQDYNMAKYALWFHNNTPGNLERLKEKFGREVVAVQLAPYRIESGTPTATMTAIGRKSRYPEKAMKMIELLNTDKEIYNLVSYGIEGQHYKKLDDLHVSYIENSGYAPKEDWAFGNQFNAFLLEDMADDTWEQTRKLNDEAVDSPLLGFNIDIQSIQSEISQCQSVVGEYKGALMGTLALEDYYNEMISKLEAAGIDKIAAEVQRQYDEWMANKQ